MTVGNDVSSRDIEGANPLYIPQAKVFAGACAIGPALAVPDDWDAPLDDPLQIADGDGRELFAGETSTAKMKRTPIELAEWVVRDNPVPAGIDPPDRYRPRAPGRLHPGAGPRGQVEIEGIGTLVNTVATNLKGSSEVIDAPARPTGRNYVGGEWRPSSSGATYAKLNPMRPSEKVGEFSASTEDDAAAAVAAAADAFAAWAALPLARRGAYLVAAAASLEARTEEIARDMSTEMGKPLREARGETGRAAQILRFAASEAFRPVGEHFEQSATGAQVSTHRRPVGVVALITPWNFPIAIPVWKLAPALMYGNAVVLKLAYEAPLTGLHVAEAFADAELPPGVLNVLTGRGSTVGAALVHDPRVRAISFTGSVATGHGVRDEATKAGKRVQLELGGHNPLIVMDDADLGRAVEAAYAGAFWSAGQKCTATRRIYVQDGATTSSVPSCSRGSSEAASATRSITTSRSGRSSTSRSSTRSSPPSSAAGTRVER